jgi:hypothetical protein
VPAGSPLAAKDDGKGGDGKGKPGAAPKPPEAKADAAWKPNA